MNLFGLSFFLFVLKWSAGKGFWYQFRVTDKPPFKNVVTVERMHKKVEKFKPDVVSKIESLGNLLLSNSQTRNSE